MSYFNDSDMDFADIEKLDITKHDTALEDFYVVDNTYEVHYIEYGEVKLKDWQECILSVKKGESIAKAFEQIQNEHYNAFFLRVVIYNLVNKKNEFLW